MHLQVNHNNTLTDNQRAVIDGYFMGHTTDKQLARYLDISIAALRSRMNSLFYRAGIPFGTRRDQAMLMIWQNGLIQVDRIVKAARKSAAVLLLCVLGSGFFVPSSLNDSPTDMARTGRTRSGRTQRRRDAADDVIDNLTQWLTI